MAMLNMLSADGGMHFADWPVLNTRPSHWAIGFQMLSIEAMANLNDTERPPDPTHMLPEFAKSAKCLATWVQ